MPSFWAFRDAREVDHGSLFHVNPSWLFRWTKVHGPIGPCQSGRVAGRASMAGMRQENEPTGGVHAARPGVMAPWGCDGEWREIPGCAPSAGVTAERTTIPPRHEGCRRAVPPVQCDGRCVCGKCPKVSVFGESGYRRQCRPARRGRWLAARRVRAGATAIQAPGRGAPPRCGSRRPAFGGYCRRAS